MSELLKKYQSIDESKLNEATIKILNRVKTITADFTTEDKKNNEIAEQVLDGIMQKNPDAVKIVKREPKAKPALKKTHKATHTTKASKTAKSTHKTTSTPTTNSTSKGSGNNIMSVAKEIQKEGESWKDAMERAKVVLKERKEQVVQKQKTELEKLYALVKTKKELQGFANSDIKRDAVREAKVKGARFVTKEGSTSNAYGTFPNKIGRKYWETRDRHADRLAPKYPKDMPLLADGDGIDGGMNNLTIQNVSFAKGGKIKHTFKVGETVSFPSVKNPNMDKPILDRINYFSNKELVIEKIKVDKPFNLADVYVKNTGEKFKDLILNPNFLKIYADGGNVDEVAEIYVSGYPYFIKKMGDTTHFKMSNSKDGLDLVSGSHIGQHRGEEYYEDVRSWLKGGKSPNGKIYKSEYFANGGEIESSKIWDLLSKEQKGNFITKYKSEIEKNLKLTRDIIFNSTKNDNWDILDENIKNVFKKHSEKKSYYFENIGKKVTWENFQGEKIKGEIDGVDFDGNYIVIGDDEYGYDNDVLSPDEVKFKDTSKKKFWLFSNGGSVHNERMFNFLKDDLAELEKAINEGNNEEVERFFSYWVGSSGHLKSLETETNNRMYNFLKDDLLELEKAIKDDNKEEVERFFSYWVGSSGHLESIKMANGGFTSDVSNGTQFMNGVYEKGGVFYKEGSNKFGLGNTEIFVQEENDMYCVYDNIWNDENENWEIKKISDFDTMDEAKEFAIEYSKKEYGDGGSLPFMTDPNFGNFQNNGMFENGGKLDGNMTFYENDYRRLVDDRSENYPFFSVKTGSYWEIKKEKDESIVAKWFPKNNILKLNKNQDKDLVEWLHSNSYLSQDEYYKFELGGAFMMTDLAGHTGGSDGLGNPMPLSGVSGTHYTGLVGETGAMSSGELFENGGGIKMPNLERRKKYVDSFTKEELVNWLSQNWGYRGFDNNAVTKNPKKRDINNLRKEVLRQMDYNDKNVYEAGGVMMQNQQVINDASQSYVNYYLGEGASQGIYKDGGSIPNNYEGRTAEDIWNNWTIKQKRHFLIDHYLTNTDYNSEDTKQVEDTKYLKYNELPRMVQTDLLHHKAMGQYAYGGKTKSRQSMKELYIEQIASLTGTRTFGIEKFIDDNGLTESELSNLMTGIGRGMISKSDFVTALVGEKNNPIQKQVIEFAKSDKAYKMANGGDILPPSKTYGENIYKAMQKFNISESEARKKYGQFTINQWNELLSKKMANGGFTSDVSNGTQFMNNVYADGGSIDGQLNKKIQKLAEKEGLTMNKFGRDGYNLVMIQALRESLTDANHHLEARQLVSKAEMKEWSNELYKSIYFNPEPNVNSFARKVAEECSWNLNDILNAYYFVTKMEGSKVANIIEDLFFKTKAKNNNSTNDWWQTIVNPNENFNNFDDEKPINWEVDDFKSWVVSHSDLDGNIDDEVFEVVKMPKEKLTVEYLNKNGSGKNNDEYYKQYGNWGSALYDVFTQMKRDYLAGKSSSKPSKYIDHDNIKTVAVKYKGKETRFKGEDVLNGVNLLEEGGDLSKIAFYIPKRDVIEVELKDGSTIKPMNGYWIKKGSVPFSNLGISFSDGGGIEFNVEKGDVFKITDKGIGLPFRINKSHRIISVSEYFVSYELVDNYKEKGQITLSRFKKLVEDGVIFIFPKNDTSFSKKLNYAKGGDIEKSGYAIMQKGALRTDAYGKVEFFDTIEKALFKMSHVPNFKSLTKEEKLKLIVPYTKDKKSYADGGDLEKSESLKYFILNEASSGMIANKTPYSDYKSIDRIKLTAIQILNRDGDRPYSVKAFSDLIQEAIEEDNENNPIYAERGVMFDDNDGFMKADNENNYRYPNSPVNVETTDEPIDLTDNFNYPQNKVIIESLDESMDLTGSDMKVKMGYNPKNRTPEKMMMVNQRMVVTNLPIINSETHRNND